jgi:hypothetical protein
MEVPMPLFVVTHRHAAESCPPSVESAAQLLSHVSASNAARYGVTLLAEALIDWEHRLLLILEASDRAKVERFLAFFVRFGSVAILPASSSETAIARGACVAGQPQESAAPA